MSAAATTFTSPSFLDFDKRRRFEAYLISTSRKIRIFHVHLSRILRVSISFPILWKLLERRKNPLTDKRERFFLFLFLSFSHRSIQLGITSLERNQ